jgi:hypothetical protein
MLLLLIAGRSSLRPREAGGRAALRLGGAFAAIVVIGVTVLWAFYGFRYAARPAGLALSTSLADYAQASEPFQCHSGLAIAHLHLLPESYLMGLVDVKRHGAVLLFLSSSAKLYAHGVWWYFPVVILIKDHPRPAGAARARGLLLSSPAASAVSDAKYSISWCPEPFIWLSPCSRE